MVKLNYSSIHKTNFNLNGIIRLHAIDHYNIYLHNINENIFGLDENDNYY